MPKGVKKGKKRIFDTFFEHIRVRGECWIWTGQASGGVYKYGVVRDPSQKRYRQATHISLEKHLGISIPRGSEVCHRCDEPLCIRPKHLFVASHDENMKDAARKKRFPTGVKNHSSKLNWIKVKWIRKHYRRHDRKFGGGAMARKFGVCEQLIIQVLQRKIWK